MANQPNQRPLDKDFYIYSTYEAGAIAPGGNFTNNIDIDADSTFVWQKLTAFADIAAAGQTDSTRVLPLISIQFIDTGSGRQVFNREIPIPALCGYGGLPFVLHNPRRFASNSTIVITGTNYDAANSYSNIYILLIGYKIYHKGGR